MNVRHHQMTQQGYQQVQTGQQMQQMQQQMQQMQQIPQMQQMQQQIQQQMQQAQRIPQTIQSPMGAQAQQQFNPQQLNLANAQKAQPKPPQALQPPVIRQSSNVQSQAIPLQMVQQEESSEQIQVLKRRISALEELNMKLLHREEGVRVVRVESDEEAMRFRQEVEWSRRELEEKERRIAELREKVESMSTRQHSLQSLELEIGEKDRLVYRLQSELQEVRSQEYLVEQLRREVEESKRVIARLQMENESCLREKDVLVNRIQTQQHSQPQMLEVRQLAQENEQLLAQVRQLKALAREQDFRQEEIYKAKLVEAEAEIRKLLMQNQSYQVRLQEAERGREVEVTSKRMQSRYALERQELEEQLSMLQRKGREKDARNEELTREVDALKEALNSKNYDYEAAIRKAQEHQSLRVRDDEGRQRSAENQLHDLMAENQSLKKRLFEAEGRAEQLLQQFALKERQLQEHQEQLRRAQQVTAQIGSERERENQQIGAIEAQLQHKAKENTQLKAELEKLRQLLRDSEERAEQAADQLSKAQYGKTQHEFMLNQQLQQMQDQLLQAQHNQQHLQLKSDETDDWKNKYLRLDSQYQDLKHKQAKLDAELTRLQDIEDKYQQAQQKTNQLDLELRKQLNEINALHQKFKVASEQLSGINSTKQQEANEIRKWKERALEAEKDFEYQLREQLDSENAKIQRLQLSVKELQEALKVREDALLKEKTRSIDMENQFQVNLTTLEGKLNVLAAENQSFKKRIEMEKDRNGGELSELRLRVNELLKENEKISHLLHSERNHKDEQFIHYQTVATKLEAENHFLKTVKEDLENQLKDLYEKFRLAQLARKDKPNWDDDHDLTVRKLEQKVREQQLQIDALQRKDQENRFVEKENRFLPGDYRDTRNFNFRKEDSYKEDHYRDDPFKEDRFVQKQQDDKFKKQNQVFNTQLKEIEKKQEKEQQPFLLDQLNEYSDQTKPLTKAQQLIGYKAKAISTPQQENDQFKTQLAQTANFHSSDKYQASSSPYSATYNPQQKASIGLMGLPEVPKSFQNILL